VAIRREEPQIAADVAPTAVASGEGVAFGVKKGVHGPVRRAHSQVVVEE
jgi:hypothetical protein